MYGELVTGETSNERLEKRTNERSKTSETFEVVQVLRERIGDLEG